MNELALYRYENQYSDLLFTASDAKGVTYITDKGSRKLAIMADRRGKKPTIVVLSEEQAKILSEELPDMLMFIGRGRFIDDRRGKHDGIDQVL